MSLIMSEDGGLVKTNHHMDEVMIRRGSATIYLSVGDFCEAAAYVITNTDLMEDDPRVKLMEVIKKLSLQEGYNKGCQRFA